MAMSASAEDSKIWFIFLVKGNGHRPPQAEVEKMQDQHIGNFKRLFGLKKLLGAGPLQDPTTIKRGIVIIKAPDIAAVHECFLPDPYVQGKIMNIEAHPWNVDLKGLNFENPDPNGIEENRFAIVKGDGPIPDYLMKQHREWVIEHVKPTLSGPFETDKYQEVFLFHGADRDANRKALETDPLVRLGWVKLEWMPLWMGKGALREG